MFRRFKIALAIIFGLLWVLTFRGAAWLMNKPSDLALYAGILVILVSFVVYPTVFMKVLFSRKKKVNESPEPHLPTAA